GTRWGVGASGSATRAIGWWLLVWLCVTLASACLRVDEGQGEHPSADGPSSRVHAHADVARDEPLARDEGEGASLAVAPPGAGAVAPSAEIEPWSGATEQDSYLTTDWLLSSAPGFYTIRLSVPAVTPRATPVRQPYLHVPILMYHYIRDNPDPTDILGARLSISPRDFAAQMRFLAERGYQPVGLDALLEERTADRRLPRKPVVLTFDDGYADAFTAAFPVLQQRRFPATFYVATDLVGLRGHLTWPQVRALADAGMEIGSHTIGHADLPSLPLTLLRRELNESRRLLERGTGRPVKHFSYPSGRVDDRVRQETQAAGYQTAVTTQYRVYGGIEDLWLLPRVRVLGRASLYEYALMLGEDPTGLPTPTPTLTRTITATVPLTGTVTVVPGRLMVGMPTPASRMTVTGTVTPRSGSGPQPGPPVTTPATSGTPAPRSPTAVATATPPVAGTASPTLPALARTPTAGRSPSPSPSATPRPGG
ncbi:MAG: polysaccharide deacetylase family protein, partial [Chloroflexi bacterium]|nr:polysaccharide deacetylase family protein [Chloroflexota bacterium]